MLGFKWDVSVWEILESKEWEREILNGRNRSGNCGSDRHGSEINRDATKKRQQEKNSRILLEMDSSNPKYGKS